MASKKKILLFAIEMLILFCMLGLYLLVRNSIELKSFSVEVKEEISVDNTEILDSEMLSMYRNIVLFGLDSGEESTGKGIPSDTIMIISINEETHEIKLISVYRDTYLNIGEDIYKTARCAYAQGGAEQAIKMLNRNMDLNIQDYVTLGFTGMTEVVNLLGGIMVDIQSSEIDDLNAYQNNLSKELNCSYTAIETAGYQRIDGIQAWAYTKIHYTEGDDFRSTQIQRSMFIAILEEARKKKISTLDDIASEVFEHLATSLTLREIEELQSKLTEYVIVGDVGFPFANEYISEQIHMVNSIIPTTLEENIVILYEWLYETEEYEVSDKIIEYSNQINLDTKQYAY